MKVLKILIDARMYGLEHSGIGRYLINLTEELKNLGTEEKFIILLRKRYFNVLKFPANWTKVLADFRHYSLAEQIKLPKIICEQNADIVHFPHFNMPYFYKGKFIVTIHDMTMHKQGVSATNLLLPIYFLKRIPYKIVFKKCVKDSVKIITPTESVKKELVDYFNIDENKVAPIYEGISEAYLKETGKKSIRKRYGLENDYFIYTGNVYPHKNIERVIEAILQLNKQLKKQRDGLNGKSIALHSAILFAVVSSRNVFTRRLKKLVRSMNAEKYVRFLGFVPDRYLTSLYKNSIAFVYSSLSEGFGLQGLEVMAAAGLLLASDISVFREVYQDNALYFNPYDFSSIAKAMKEALQMKKEQRRKRIKKAQKFVKRYSWTKMAKETLRVYKEAIEQ